METVNQENNSGQDQGGLNQSGQQASGQVERTFTQAELDAVIGDRLQRERAKYADYETLKDKAAKYDAAEEAGKTELQRATEKANNLEKELNDLKVANQERALREKISTETGVPASLLRGASEEELKTQAQAILDFAAQKAGYPAVHDAGEVVHVRGGSTREQFKDWFNDALGK